jgi:hypothetical protein
MRVGTVSVVYESSVEGGSINRRLFESRSRSLCYNNSLGCARIGGREYRSIGGERKEITRNHYTVTGLVRYLEQLANGTDGLFTHVCRVIKTHPSKVFEVYIFVHTSRV